VHLAVGVVEHGVVGVGVEQHPVVPVARAAAARQALRASLRNQLLSAHCRHPLPAARLRLQALKKKSQP